MQAQEIHDKLKEQFADAVVEFSNEHNKQIRYITVIFFFIIDSFLSIWSTLTVLMLCYEFAFCLNYDFYD